jgi:energy-coupling factor transporter ATP-binding protein EcfA2
MERGMLTVISGENGAGKSISLAALAAALDATQLSIVSSIEGTVFIPPVFGKRVALVRQDPLDNFISRSASDELAVPLLNYGFSETDARQRIEKVLAELDLSLDLLNQPVANLSGGQRQLFAIAVATAIAPDVLLLDEPLARLDDFNARLVLKAMGAVLENTVVVVSTHDAWQYCRAFPGRVYVHEVSKKGTNIQLSRIADAPPAPSPNDHSELRRTVEIIPGTGEVCFKVCPGNLSVFHTSNKKPLIGCAEMTFATGTNVLYGGNGAGKTLLARCLAGQVRINSLLPLVLGALSDFGGFLSGLHAKGSLEYVLPAKLKHSGGVPAVTFYRYRKSGLSAYRPPEPSWFLSEGSVETELRRFVSSVDLKTRFEYLAARGIRPDDRLSQLSFGQQKLVMFGSIPGNARLVVLDEPLSGLSLPSREGVIGFLKELLMEAGAPSKCFVVTANKWVDRQTFVAAKTQ